MDKVIAVMWFRQKYIPVWFGKIFYEYCKKLSFKNMCKSVAFDK